MVTPYECEKFHTLHMEYPFSDNFNEIWKNYYLKTFKTISKTNEGVQNFRKKYWEDVIGLIANRPRDSIVSRLISLSVLPKNPDFKSIRTLIQQVEHHVSLLILTQVEISDYVIDVIYLLTHLVGVRFTNYRSTRGFHDVVLANENISKIDLRFGFFTREDFETFCNLMVGRDVTYPEEVSLGTLFFEPLQGSHKREFHLYDDNIFASKKRNTSMTNNITEFQCYSVDLRSISESDSFRDFLQKFGLKSINFCFNHISDDQGAVLLSHLSCIDTLESCAITENYLGAKSIEFLSGSSLFQRLTSLNLLNNSLSPSCLSNLIKFLQKSNVTSLDLSTNDFAESNEIFSLFTNKTKLIDLNLRNCHIDLGKEFFQSVLTSRTITKLDIGSNFLFSDDTTANLTNFLLQNNSITELSLVDMKFPLEPLMDALKRCEVFDVIKLTITHPRILDLCQIILDRYKNSKKKITFDISSITIPPKTIRSIQTLYDDTNYDLITQCIVHPAINGMSYAKRHESGFGDLCDCVLSDSNWKDEY